ncbi:MAG: hypothetical protein KJ749_02255 [Planctomycetes bacterium]|nr:hypothetical protein [Planctomycetota bacterium]
MRKTLCRTIVLVVPVAFLQMSGCGVVLEEAPHITGVLYGKGVDPGSRDEVQAFVNDLLFGVEVKYDLAVEKVTPPTFENRSFFDGTTGMQRKVEVVRFSGYGARDGEHSAYTGDLYVFDNTGDVWTTLVWTDLEVMVGDEVVSEEGYRFASEGKTSVPEMRASEYTRYTMLYCGCDVSGGTVNGADCSEEDCEEIATCVRSNSDGTSTNGSCFLGGTA